MCKSVSKEDFKGSSTPSTTKGTTSRNWPKIAFVLVSVFVAAVSVLLPIIISEDSDGWTRKYTSPGPIFKASDIGDMTGKVAIVTGSNTGIGYHTALELVRNGADVIVAARSPAKGEAAVAAILEEVQADDNAGNAVYMPLDLSSLKSVKKFADDFLKLKKPLHILVNNAGVMKSPGAQYVGQNFTYGFETTVDGFESHIGINHIGHFYLTQLLTKKLKESAPSRVVALSSGAESGSYPEGMRFDLWKPSGGERDEDYEDGMAYGQSKLAAILFARELAERLEGTGVTAYSCHPGIITTELGRYMGEKMTAELHNGFETTVDGFESHIGINHIGHFYLTQLLTKKLEESSPSRVVALSSGAESGSYPEGMRFDLWKPSGGERDEDYEDGMAYGQSKLAAILFARELAERLEGTGVTAYSCHPGIITTELGRYMGEKMTDDAAEGGILARLALYLGGGIFTMANFKPEDGALTQLQLSTADPAALTNGAYYRPIGRMVQPRHAQGTNSTLQKELWTKTEKAVKGGSLL
eukprot:CAMPEP_0197464354 /NCGR_PEP_ID=MMETSP1175-20131217/63979_1 /TAXON_ID=1003142 /ORGANISM="Triceratium dubium, Strain CCMP147" /LENGTH=526 /DNA_ID=CAMNT_0043000333 /DNA_START=87 /DNA_END=1668 /DNA_ORIENTATION=+